MKRLAIIISMLLAVTCGPKEKPKATEGESRSPQWEPGITLYSFNPAPFGESLDEAKKAGIKYVEGFSFQQLGNTFDNQPLLELSGDQLKQMKKMIQDRGLQMKSLYAAAKTKDEWKRYFKLGKKLGVSFLVGEPKRGQLDVVDSLAGAYSMRLAIHEHAKGESIYWHPDSVLTALKGRPQLGVCGDLGHWVRSGLDPVESLKKLEGQLISIHAKDVDQAGNVNAPWSDLDQGVINYQAVTGELQRQGFAGPVYIEDEREGDNVDGVRAAVEYLNGLRDEQSKE